MYTYTTYKRMYARSRSIQGLLVTFRDFILHLTEELADEDELPVFSLYFLFLSLSLTFCQASGLNHVNVTLSVESGTGDQNTYKTDIDMYPYVSTSPQI